MRLSGKIGERAGERRATSMEMLLIWAVQIQRADVGSRAAGRVGPGAFGNGVSADGAFQVQVQGLLGTRVDCVGSWRQDVGAWLHPDAETVYNLAEAYPVPTNFLVLNHARSGTRPDWRPDLRPVMPITEWVYDDNRPRARVYGDRARGRYCRVIGWRDRRRDIAQARRPYSDWHAALQQLVERCEEAGLIGWTITEVGAPARPWDKES